MSRLFVGVPTRSPRTRLDASGAGRAGGGDSRRRRLVEAAWGRYHFLMETTHFPGGDLIAAGLDDLRQGLETIPALLVSIGAARLSRVGYRVPQPLSEPEQRLYGLLAQDDPAAAHSRYNGLIRRLVSFERAAECER